MLIRCSPARYLRLLSDFFFFFFFFFFYLFFALVPMAARSLPWMALSNESVRNHHHAFPYVTHEGRAREGHGAGRCGGRASYVPQDVAKDLAFGARAARALLATPPPPLPFLCSSR